VEVVGYYNPVAQPPQVTFDHDRINHWLKCGARPSDTVSRLLYANPAAAA
jgi:small subunit ribosomal protein S16